ncbi:hypothetical protein AN416_01335 [Paraburkholderia caribensis]|nr:hypothetical protein [Paraburkholderia caribensis]ALP61364.1 hypothetical protein AN416_01335 [Paraburkholderia caribensis]
MTQSYSYSDQTARFSDYVLPTALYSPVWTSGIRSGVDFAIATIGFFLLTRWKIPPLTVVMICALAGIAEAVLK